MSSSNADRTVHRLTAIIPMHVPLRATIPISLSSVLNIVQDLYLSKTRIRTNVLGCKFPLLPYEYFVELVIDSLVGNACVDIDVH